MGSNFSRIRWINCIGVIVDLIAKVRGKKIRIDEGNRKMSESERIYSENFKHETKEDINQNLF